MVLTTKKDRLLQYVAYLIVIAAFIISIVFPIVLQFREPFAAPPAVYSQMIINDGHLVERTSILPTSQVFWGIALTNEIQYPLPSILISVFMLITAIPFQYAMSIPLLAIINIIYFVLARYIFTSITRNKGYVWFFSALFYLFIAASHVGGGGTVGRAALGVPFLAFFIYIYLKFAHESNVPRYRSNHFGLVVMLVLSIFAIGFLYYFATIDIIVLMVLIIISTTFTKSLLPRKRPWLEGFILVIAIFLFLGTSIMIGIIQITSINQMFSNFIQYFGFMAGRIGITFNWLSAEPTFWNINLVQFDPIINFGNRVWFFIQWSSVFAIIACIFAYRPRKFQRSPKDVVWLFCVFIVFSSFGELGYFIIGPYEPTRLLFLFGPIVTLSIVIGIVSERNKIRKLKVNKLKFAKLKLVIAILVILVFCIGILGVLKVATTYGMASAKPFAFDNIYPFSVFISTYSPNDRPLVLASDENYAAHVFFISSHYNKTATVVAEPLLGDAITLNEVVANGDSQVFVSAMRSRQIEYLLIINDGKPVYGDVWGYIINALEIDTISQLQFSLIYNDGKAQLFQLYPASEF